MLKPKTIIIFSIIFFRILFFANSSWASTYYTNATGGSDSRTTTQAQVISTPWATIQKCSANAVAGDTCFVLAGTYNEQITPTNSGTAGRFVTFAAYQGQAVLMRGFDLTNKVYIRIVGFEITHSGLSFNAPGIKMQGSSHIEILGNYVHNTVKGTIENTNGGVSSDIIIRGNRLEYPVCAALNPGGCTGDSALYAVGSRWLIEYNSISHVGDYLTSALSDHFIYRNNFLGHNYCSDFPDAASCSSSHIDGWQPNGPITDGLVDRNYQDFGSDTDRTDRHIAWFEWNTAPNTEVIYRESFTRKATAWGNYGSMGIRFFNNTVVDAGEQGSAVIGAQAYPGGHNATDNRATGNIYYNASTPPGSSGVYYIADANQQYTADYDVWYQFAGLNYPGTNIGEAHSINSNPLFSSYASSDFTLQSGSPARSKGTAITTVNDADGSGNSFVVADARPFVGGWGIYNADGTEIRDSIIVGLNPAVKVTNVNYSTNTLTVTPSITWVNGSAIRFAHQSAIPDAGAWQYKPGGYSLTGSYTLSNGTVIVTPSDSSLVRFVEVFENGVPIGTSYSSPFTVSGVGSGQLAVKMYSMFASQAPVVSATGSIQSDTTPPAPPSGLQVV